MGGCCGTEMKDFCEQLECTVKETDKGIQIEVKPKDPAKIEGLKALAKGCRDFCGCCK